MDAIRLNKYLSEAGICSRRQADAMVDAGRIKVDGVIAVQGMKVTSGNEITVDGVVINAKKAKPVLLAVNKPKGIVCTTSDKDRNNIVDFLNYPERIYPVGRLDKESDGLVLMTNQGDIVNRILRGSNKHEKEYIVTVNKPINSQFLKAMREGVPIPDMNKAIRYQKDVDSKDVPVVMTRPCKVDQLGRCEFRIILTQGLNRQIRRMCDYLGYRVIELRRVRIMNITLGELESGKYREIRGEELKRLLALLEHSSNLSYQERKDS